MEKITFVERLLVCLNMDGTIRAAHMEKLERVTDAGAVVYERQLPAEPLTPDALVAAVGEESSTLIAQCSAQLDALALASEQAEHDARRIDELEAQVAALRDQLAEAVGSA